MHLRQALLCGAVSVACAASAHAAMAQQAGGASESAAAAGGAAAVGAVSPAGAAAAAAAGAANGQVVVYARRRAEALQKVPVAIAAISKAQLAERSIKSTTDLTSAVPGVHLHYSGTSSNPDIESRGASRLPLGDTPGAVAVYFAEVPLSNESTFIPTFDLGSVEVLKGPQGTLFGRNALTGAILIAPSPPTYQFGGDITASYGNYNYRALEGDVNIPIIDDKVALRIAGEYRARDGYMDRIAQPATPPLAVPTFLSPTGFIPGSPAFGGDKTNDLDRSSLRASLLLQPFNGFKNTTVLDYFNADEAGSSPILYYVSPVGVAYEGLGPLFAQQKKLGVYANASTGLQSEKRQLFGLTNRTEYDFGSVQVRNIFGYRTSALTDISDTDATPYLFVHVGDVTHQEQITNEFQVLGKSFGDRLNWIGGVFYSNTTPNGSYGTIEDVFGPGEWGEAYQKRESRALYGQIDYSLNDFVHGLSITAGVRQTWDNLSVCSLSAFGGNSPPIGPAGCSSYPGEVVGPLTIPPSSTIKDSSSATTYTLSLNYQVLPNLLFYFANRKGYREGGINTPAFNTPDVTTNPAGPDPLTGACPAPNPAGECRDIRSLQSYAPEVDIDFELGMKGNWNIGGVAVQLDADIYDDYLQQDQNLTVLNAINNLVNLADPGVPPFSAVTYNDGTVRVQGLEAELDVRPIDNLDVYANLSYSDGHQISSPVISIPLFPNVNDAVRRTVDYGLGARYAWVLDGSSRLIYNIDYYHNDKNDLAPNQPGENLPCYNLINMRLTWQRVMQANVDLSFFVTNVTGEKTFLDTSQGNPGFGFTTVHIGEPRMFGVDATYHFGG
jgi:iron complex outermembrane recepter protein